jgi:hypothetical protein
VAVRGEGQQCFEKAFGNLTPACARRAPSLSVVVFCVPEKAAHGLAVCGAGESTAATSDAHGGRKAKKMGLIVSQMMAELL